jgi:hypothetical protein
MKITTQPKKLAVLLTALIAAQAAFIMNTSHAQTFQTVTNGLVDYYPLNSTLAGTTNVTPDYISRRDLKMSVALAPANFVSGSHSGMGDSVNVANLTQSGGPTVMYYQSIGQNLLTGGGDFLPFINQRGATMNFWIKAAYTGANDARLMAECANNGDNNPFFSLGQNAGNSGGVLEFLRENATSTDPNGITVNLMPDGTYQTPSAYYINAESTQYTTNIVYNGNWHMFTYEIETNGDCHVYVDGIYDSGNQSTAVVDNEGNPAYAAPLSVTNTYYNTNTYPFAPGTTNGGPGLPYVHWMVPGLNLAGPCTAFGGFLRNGSFGGGAPVQLSDIGFWNRTLTPAELQFVMTNGLPGLTLNTNIISINNFAAGISEIGQGGIVNLSWNITGVNSTPGSIAISGLGDVSYLGPVGSTNITLPANQTYTFTLTAHNGIVADKTASTSVKVLQGVPTSWNLIQRFDGLFGNTTAGVNGFNMVSLLGNYAGNLDRFNVVTVNGNEALSPKSDYLTDAGSSIGYDSRGALTWASLNNLTVPPQQVNTVFFRFSLTTPPTVNNGTTNLYSGLDLGIGITDFGFATGPLGGSQPPNAGLVGPGFRIVNYDASGNYGLVPYDLEAFNWTNGAAGGTSDGYAAGYDYLTDTVNGNANGLMTNVNYYCWLDVSNDNTHAVVNGTITNTVQEARFALWIQAQGASSRTLLFSNFYGNRDYSQNGLNNDNMSPYLNKVFASVGTEAFQSGDNGAFFATNNMVLLDDFYMSTNGYNGTIPRLFNLTSIAKAAGGNVTIKWESLGSLFQTNTYSVQRKLNINDPSWTTLTNGLPSGGDFTSFTDSTIGSANNAFYRITWP